MYRKEETLAVISPLTQRHLRTSIFLRHSCNPWMSLHQNWRNVRLIRKPTLVACTILGHEVSFHQSTELPAELRKPESLPTLQYLRSLVVGYFLLLCGPSMSHFLSVLAFVFNNLLSLCLCKDVTCPDEERSYTYLLVTHLLSPN